MRSSMGSAVLALVASAHPAIAAWHPAASAIAPTPAVTAVFNAEKAGAQMVLGGIVYDAAGEAPEPTPRARLPERDVNYNTCGYISGIATAQLYCSAQDDCVYNTVNSIIGCCPASSTGCPVYTQCLAKSQTGLFDGNANYTQICTQSTDTECVTYMYGEGAFTGYSLLACGSSKEIVSVYFTPLTSSDLSSSSTGPSSRSSSTIPTHPVTVTATPTPTVTNKSHPKKKTNVGAIVGGVVGGIGGLALIAAAAFFALRHRKKSQQAPIPPTAAVAGAPAPGAPGGPGSPVVAYDPATGAPVYSNPGSPSPGSPFPPSGMQETKPYFGQPAGSPPPPGVAGYPVAYNNETPSPGIAASPSPAPAAYQQPGAAGLGFQSGPVPATFDVAELPAERQSGQAHEMA